MENFGFRPQKEYLEEYNKLFWNTLILNIELIEKCNRWWWMK